MKKILLIFGVITIFSGLVLTFFSGAIVPRKRYWYVRDMRVREGESRFTGLYYKPKPTSNITLDVIVMLYNKTGSITVQIRGPEVDESQILVNWTGCRFTLPPVHSLDAFVDNNTPEYIRVYFIMSYDAKETDTLFYAGLFFTALGIIEVVVYACMSSSSIENLGIHNNNPENIVPKLKLMSIVRINECFKGWIE